MNGNGLQLITIAHLDFKKFTLYSVYYFEPFRRKWFKQKQHKTTNNHLIVFKAVSQIHYALSFKLCYKM